MLAVLEGSVEFGDLDLLREAAARRE